jgi:hypothetical protein
MIRYKQKCEFCKKYVSNEKIEKGVCKDCWKKYGKNQSK